MLYEYIVEINNFKCIKLRTKTNIYIDLSYTCGYCKTYIIFGV